MTEPKKVELEKRDRLQPKGDPYNPVNMAGKGIQVEKPSDGDERPAADPYNPVNMAGKKVDLEKDGKAKKPA